MAFVGKTVFVTGSSRGIGRAIALKFAEQGANVVVAAKTVEASKLSGTIHQTADEVNQRGGKGLPIQVDLRDEEQIKNAVDKTVAQFGGIDILVNNASAIFLANVENMPMKRWDLVNSINIRGTYTMSKYAIPHLKKAQNPHIITLSPPLELRDIWFKNHTGYTMSKYGMSLCTYGLAAELKGQVGCNTLWPKTSIWTAAMDMLAGEQARVLSRKPEIMADAAFAIASKDKSVTGNFYIDEEVLRGQGVTDFEQYAEEPGSQLLPDFFLPERIMKEFDPSLFKKVTAAHIDAVKKGNSTDKSLSDKNESGVGSVFASASSIMTDEMKADMNATLHFVISGQDWTIVSKENEPFQVLKDKPVGNPDVILTTDEATFIKMAKGETKPTSAFMVGKLRVKGSMGLALKVEKLFVKMKGKL